VGGTCRLDNVKVAGTAIPPPAPELTVSKSAAPSASPLLPGGSVAYSLVVAHAQTSPVDAASLVLGDALPAHTTIAGDIGVSGAGLGPSVTAALDDDAGEVVGGVLTLRLGDLPLGAAPIVVSFDVTVGPLADPVTLSNTASLAYSSAGSGAHAPAVSNTTSTFAQACGDAADCDDGDHCSDDACIAAGCIWTANSGTPSDNAETCDGEYDVCDAGAWVGTSTLDCDDGNA
jgi:hypothetical protein